MASSSKKNKKRDRARRAHQPELNTTALWVAVVLSVIGAALSLYATNLTFTIASAGIVESSGCSVNDWINCDLAQGSSYARMFGIPVAVWGMIFYVFAGLAAVSGVVSKNRANTAAFVSAAWVLSIGSVLFSVWKAFNLYTLGVLCPVCVGMYAANLGLMFTLPAGLKLKTGQWKFHLGQYFSALRGKDSDLLFAPKTGTVALVLIIFFGVGFSLARNYEKQLKGPSNFNEKLAMNSHFRQPPIEVTTDSTAAVWGNPDAAITIVEFADFQCPACKESAAHLRPTLYEFRNDVKLVFMNYPLDKTINVDMASQLHALAGDAARAGVCSQEFGDFWTFHDDLFRNQVSLGSSLYRRLATQRGWDVQAFTACMARPETTSRIKSDISHGRATHLNSTPTLFVNGRKLTYWRNTEFIRAVIREELDRL